MNYIGVDPGLRGGVAWTFQGHIISQKFPGTEEGFRELIVTLPQGKETTCVIETQWGRATDIASRIWKLAENYAEWKLAMRLQGCDVHTVAAVTWQKYFGLIFPDTPKTEKKNRHKDFAKELFPNQSVTHATADALLIMEYARKHY